MKSRRSLQRFSFGKLSSLFWGRKKSMRLADAQLSCSAFISQMIQHPFYLKLRVPYNYYEAFIVIIKSELINKCHVNYCRVRYNYVCRGHEF